MPTIRLADSSVWISYMRSGKYRDFLFTKLAKQTLFLPGPVLSELYAGAITREDRRDVESLRSAVGPNCVATVVEDWVEAGRLLAAYSSLFGKIKPGDHLVDALLIITAVKLGACVASENLRDMKRWAKTLGAKGRKLRLETPRP